VRVGLDPDLADLADRDLAVIVVAERDLDARDRHADRALLDPTGNRIQGREPDLGHAVALVDEEADELGELLLELERHLVRAAAAETE